MKMNPTLNRLNTRSFPSSDMLLLPPSVSKREQGASHRRLCAVKNGQRFPCFSGRARVKRLVQDYRFRIATWNIVTLTGRTMELVDVMIRRRVCIACIQET